jgi:putative hydrolase of the HAD superfamily
MIIIFDLDDTLYDERTYVESGLLAVAKFGEEKYGWDSSTSFHFMIDTLDNEGRGEIFNRWLEIHGKLTKKAVHECVRIYRHHTPFIELGREAQSLLLTLSKYPLYLVTDGHKVVQKKKIDALDISDYFQAVFITHRYGIRNAKPSTYCFDLIRKREACDWSDMVYIGDNPEKDFVNLNLKGANTVRVLTGLHSCVKAKHGYDAIHTIPDLHSFPELLESLSN